MIINKRCVNFRVINKGRELTRNIYQPVDVHFVTHIVGECLSSITMRNILNQLSQHDFSRGLAVHNLKDKKHFSKQVNRNRFNSILLYIREDIPSKMLKFKQVQNNFKGFFVKINLTKKMWLLSCSYKPNKKNIVNRLKNITAGLDQFSAAYDNLILGDFNVKPEKESMLDFLNIYNLKHLVKQKT